MTSEDHHALVEAENDRMHERQERDHLGEVVREAWIKRARQQPSPKPSWLVPYSDLNEADKEADRQIGEAVAKLYDEAREKAEADARAWCRLAHSADSVAGAQKARAERFEELADKYKWQFRYTCVRAEKAEFDLKVKTAECEIADGEIERLKNALSAEQARVDRLSRGSDSLADQIYRLSRAKESAEEAVAVTDDGPSAHPRIVGGRLM